MVRLEQAARARVNSCVESVLADAVKVAPSVAFLVFWNLLLAHYRDALKSMSVNFVKFEEIENLIVTLGGKAFESVFSSTIFMSIKSFSINIVFPFS